MKLLSSFSSLLLLFFGINGCRGQDSNEVVELILEFALDKNLLDLLNFELLSEKCLNHSLVLQQRLENPIQVLTDGFWNLKSKLLYSYTHCKGIPNIAIKKLKSNLGYLTIRPWPFYNSEEGHFLKVKNACPHTSPHLRNFYNFTSWTWLRLLHSWRIKSLKLFSQSYNIFNDLKRAVQQFYNPNNFKFSNLRYS